MEKNKKYFWIVWDVDCPIARNNKKDFEKYLVNHEKNLIPRFRKYITEYARFREEEMDKKFGYKVLREIKI